MSNFGFLATPTSLTFTNLEGKTITITDTHQNFEKVKELIKTIQQQSNMGLDDSDKAYVALFDELESLIAPTKKITESGDIEIKNGVLYFEGQELKNVLTERILWGISEGFDMQPYINFLKNLMQNPSYRSTEQLFNFIERHKMGISDDGYILAYKKVSETYMDLYTGTMDNSPGKLVNMPRNRVSDDPNDTCSKGLHFCAMSYLSHFGISRGNKIVIVKVNPKDVVSVPVDHDAAKVRCCEYLVLSEYDGPDKEDLLGSKPVFSDDEFKSSVSEDDWLNDDEEDWNEENDDWNQEEDLGQEIDEIVEHNQQIMYDGNGFSAVSKSTQRFINSFRRFEQELNDEEMDPTAKLMRDTRGILGKDHADDFDDQEPVVEAVEEIKEDLVTDMPEITEQPSTPSPQVSVAPVQLDLFNRDIPTNLENLFKGMK